jgi:hypothetical protein
MTDLERIAKDLAQFYDDPFGYVMWAFPWGELGTPLEHFSGPRAWQKDFLLKLGREIKARKFNGRDPVPPIQMALATGHSIGKTALTAMLIKFIMDTRPFCKGVVTANTNKQLKTKTWSELGKWHAMSLTNNLFAYSSSQSNMSLSSNESPDSWRVDAMTSEDKNSESFAGLHANTSTPFYIFDEASAISEKIFEVAQGGLVDGEPMIFAFGNPTRNTGFFRQIFSKFKHRWLAEQIDSRNVEGTNKSLIEQWVKDYGDDSDFVRVRVSGRFPKASVCQLIPTDLAESAKSQILHPSKYSFAPKVLGVDVAWYGDDRSCIWLRQGLSSSLLFQGREIDSPTLAGLIGQFEDEHKTDATFIDAGMGNGVIDQLRLLGRSPTPVYFGGKAIKDQYVNKRAEMWGELLEWLKLGGSLPKNEDVTDDLIGPEYFFNLKGQLQLEPKEDMKKRGLQSPDLADGLALTFAFPVHKLSKTKELERLTNSSDVEKVETDYEVI